MMSSKIVESCRCARESCLKYFKTKMSLLDKICCFLGELIGTALLIFLGCMGCVSTDVWPNSPLQMSLNFGLVVMIIIQSFGCVSGAHLNPAVTLAAYIYNLVSLPMAILYALAQCLGAFMGYGLLKIFVTPDAMFPLNAAHGMCITTVHTNITTWQGVGIEFIITGVLVLVCCGVWDPRNSRHQDSVAIRFGLTIACLSITAGPFTGASMNPARSFGPALWNYDFTDHWVYWVAPLAGAGITALIYKTVFRREIEDERGATLLRINKQCQSDESYSFCVN